MIIPTAREAQQQAKERTLEKQEQLCELSRALAVLASASVMTGLNSSMIIVADYSLSYSQAPLFTLYVNFFFD